MDKVKCIHCETDNSINSKYCMRCGYELPMVITEIPTEKMTQTTTDKRKISFKTLIGIAIGFGTIVIIQQLFFNKPSYEKAMMEIASELNKTCPVMVDAETRLDNTVALPDNVFQYNYTLVNMEKSSVDTMAIKNFLVPTVKNFVKTNPQMKYQRDHKTTLNYYYKDRVGLYLFLISITPDQYE